MLTPQLIRCWFTVEARDIEQNLRPCIHRRSSNYVESASTESQNSYSNKRRIKRKLKFQHTYKLVQTLTMSLKQPYDVQHIDGGQLSGDGQRR